MKKYLERVLPVFDLLIAPFALLSALVLKLVRRIGVQRMRICKSVMLKVGVFPIRDHYYEPLFNFKDVPRSLSLDRNLPGLDWNTKKQLQNLADFSFSSELNDVPFKKINECEFHFNNGFFESGDAEFWYQIIRVKKPKRIFEIGSGYSTLMAIRAIHANQIEDQNYTCHHLCIEPYEMPWLESTPVTVIREKIEDIDISVFADVNATVNPQLFAAE